MISFWILLCSAAILTIFLIKMVSENENKFLITLCSIILASNLVLLILSIDNFDEISKQDYEAITKIKNMCNEYSHCKNVYEKIMEDNKVTGFEYIDLKREMILMKEKQNNEIK